MVVLTIHAHKYVHFEVWFHLNNLYVPMKQHILNILIASKVYTKVCDTMEGD